MKAIILFYATWFPHNKYHSQSRFPIDAGIGSASAWKEQRGDQQGAVSGFSVRNYIVYDFNS